MSRLSKVLTALAVVGALAFVGPQAARAQFSYPSGYDPESGQSWYGDFHSQGGLNPFGLPGNVRAWPARPGVYSAGAYGSGYYGALSYGAYAAPARTDAATIRVVVPADAKVWFGNSATQQTGHVRLFESPLLTPGKDYTYDVKATWTENGKEVTRTRQLDVRANSGATVDFTRPKPGA